MEVKIGVVYTPKELSVESEGSIDDLIASLEQAMRDGVALVWLADTKGRRVGIPSDKIAYIEISHDDGTQRVGFGRG